MATKWFALAKGGALFLAEKPATSNNKYVPVVTVPLASCSIHIPTEGLRGKSKCACVSQPVITLDNHVMPLPLVLDFLSDDGTAMLHHMQVVEKVSAGDQPPRQGAAVTAEKLLHVCL
jgi:hypothetical protein